MADDTSGPAHLEPSELGTKEYWDAVYATELTNHTANPAEEGTVWFSDSDAEAKMLEFLEEHSSCSLPSLSPSSPPPSTPPPPVLDRQHTSFLDLGCGNGSLLFALRDDGWRGRLLGVDYSEASVALARQIASARASSDQEPAGEDGDVGFAVWDVLAGPLDAVTATPEGGIGDGEGWDVVLDKGTFDAVSLSGERDGSGRRICEGYGARVLRLLRPGGAFLVTSCNWTEAELKGWFEGGGEGKEVGKLVQVGRIEYPSFSFGGAKGQTISTLCFVKAS